MAKSVVSVRSYDDVLLTLRLSLMHLEHNGLASSHLFRLVKEDEENRQPERGIQARLMNPTTPCDMSDSLSSFFSGQVSVWWNEPHP